MAEFNAEVAIETFVDRYLGTEGKQQINNASLYAGSPMYYYCRHCREETEVLPESHTKRPRTVCDPCQALMDHGLMPRALETARKALPEPVRPGEVGSGQTPERKALRT